MFYTKEVSVDSVVIIEGTSPRMEIDKARVAFFMDIYCRKEDPVFDVPPIDVLLVQTGEPGKEIFALEDGVHRLLAQKQIKFKKIKARIRADVSISEAELSSCEVKKLLLMKACESNARHGMPLSNEERKDAVRKMAGYGCSNSEIIQTGIAGKATVYRWLQNEVNERRERAVDERTAKKELIMTLLKQGATVKKITAATGVPRTTVRRMICEAAKRENTYEDGDNCDVASSIAENSGQPLKWMPADGMSIAASGADMPKQQQWKSAENKQFDEASRERMNEIYDEIRSLEVNDATDHEIKIAILPLLAQKFPGVSKIIRDSGYAAEMEALNYELRAAKDELQMKRMELLEKNDLLQKKEEQLRKRTEICNYQCEFTMERLRREFEKYVNFMVTHINEHILVIPQVSAGDGSIIKQLTVNSIFSLLSVLEWGDDNGLSSPVTKEKFEEFKYGMAGMDMINKKIMSRISLLDEIYHKIPGMPKSFS